MPLPFFSYILLWKRYYMVFSAFKSAAIILNIPMHILGLVNHQIYKIISFHKAKITTLQGRSGSMISVSGKKAPYTPTNHHLLQDAKFALPVRPGCAEFHFSFANTIHTIGRPFSEKDNLSLFAELQDLWLLNSSNSFSFSPRTIVVAQNTCSK